ncbi:MAG: hypothetical protein HY925_07330 [Elusimicrobia bacterium]|nr:hypothetical protein [Elusimicrobiota bacterium]
MESLKHTRQAGDSFSPSERRHGGAPPRQEFTHTPADIIHVFIESIHRELELGRDPRLLPDRSQEIEFWV